MDILDELDAARELIGSREANSVANTNEAFRRAVIALEGQVEELARQRGARSDGDFANNLNYLRQKGVINEERLRGLHRIREIRNCVFHNELDVPATQARAMMAEIEAFVRATSSDLHGLMTRRVLTVDAAAPLAEAEELMFRQGISHVPVVRSGRVAGVVTELSVIRAHRERAGRASLASTTVADVMEPRLPEVRPDVSIEAVLDLLDDHSAVLVIVNGAPAGILTRRDLLQRFWLHPDME